MPFNQKPIEIVITPRAQLSRSAVSDPKDAFWQPLQGRLRAQELSIAALEGRTIREFDIFMMDSLAKHWRNSESPAFEKNVSEMSPRSSLLDKLRGSKKAETSYARNQEKAAIASRIVVKTEIAYYSSLGLLMSMEPIKDVINLFDGNFDYFQVFLGSYIPIAFAQAVEDPVFADGMGYEVEIPPSLRTQFYQNNAGGLDGVTRDVTKMGKANWAWIISNTSLVVPVLLAGGVLYVASTRLNDWTGSERRAFERLIDFQAQAIIEDRQRFKLLFDEMQRKPEPSPTQQPAQPQKTPQRKSRRNRRSR